MSRIIKIICRSFFIAALTFGASRAERQALVIRTEATAKYLTTQDPKAAAQIWTALWVNTLSDLGWTVEIGDEAKLTGRLNCDVLVMPNALCLDDAHIAGLKKYLDNRGALLASWALGARTSNGQWRGYGLVSDLIGGVPDSLAVVIGSAGALRFRSHTPVTHHIPPGFRLRLNHRDRPLGLKKTDAYITAAFWSAPTYRDDHPDSIGAEVGFAVRELPSGSRVAWFGANLDLQGDEITQNMFKTLAADLMRWLDGEGSAGVARWPKGKTHGFLVHGDIEDNFDAVTAAAQTFKRLAISTTYNILFYEAVKKPEALNAILESNGEIGLHGDDHSLFKGLTVDLQIRRLSNALQIASLWNAMPKGFRPPELAYDDNTLEALRRVNFLYLLADNYPDRDYPRLVRSDARTSYRSGLVLFPKSELDDYDLIGKMSLKNTAEMTRLILKDYERLKDEGGLHKLNYHTQYLTQAQFLKTVESVYDKIKMDPDVWIATAEEISRWILRRENLLLTSESKGKTVALTLRNDNTQAAADIVLVIDPPAGMSAATMRPTKISRDATFDVKGERFLLYLPKLNPGEQFSAQVEAGAGPALTESKKNFLGFAFKVALAAAALFVLWFVYYLIFASHRFNSIKIPEPDALTEPVVQIEPPLKIDTKIKPAPALIVQPAIENSAENESKSADNKVIKRLEKTLKKLKTAEIESIQPAAEKILVSKPAVNPSFRDIGESKLGSAPKLAAKTSDKVVVPAPAEADAATAPPAAAVRPTGKIEAPAIDTGIVQFIIKQSAEETESTQGEADIASIPAAKTSAAIPPLVKSTDANIGGSAFKPLIRTSAPLPSSRTMSPSPAIQRLAAALTPPVESAPDSTDEPTALPPRTPGEDSVKEPEIYRNWQEIERRFVRTSIDVIKQQSRRKSGQDFEWH